MGRTVLRIRRKAIHIMTNAKARLPSISLTLATSPGRAIVKSLLQVHFATLQPAEVSLGWCKALFKLYKLK